MAEDNADITGRPPDPYVSARVSEPGAPPAAGVSLAGLLGDSDRPDHRRLYLNTRLDYYVEFAVSDVVGVESVPAADPPFIGLDATRVQLTRDAVVNWTRSRPAADLFAVDAVVRDERMLPQFTETWEARCPGVTERFGQSAFARCQGGGATGHGGGTGPTTTGPWPQETRFGATCQNCTWSCDGTCAGGTCGGATCGDVTCANTCGAGTCVTCGRWTCDRGCPQATQEVSCVGTCVTCNATCEASCWGTCDGATCGGATCQGTCGRDTCVSCQPTCGPTCETCHHTCNPGGCFTARLSDCAMC